MTKLENLKDGMKVMIYPTKNSQSRHPYQARIVKKDGELFTYAGYYATINDYLLSRMEIIG